MKRHLILVGLPGSGKSTVGRLVAERLGAAFIDVDAIIIRRMQMPVARIFGEFGEIRDRELEREAMETTLAGEPAVISPAAGGRRSRARSEAATGRACVDLPADARDHRARPRGRASCARCSTAELRPGRAAPVPRARAVLPARRREVKNDPPITAERRRTASAEARALGGRLVRRRYLAAIAVLAPAPTAPFLVSP
jgi:hypothetical protein